MSSPAILAPETVSAAGTALIHSLWQCALVAAGLSLVLLGLRRATAHARYLASCAALALMLVLPMATFVASQSAGPRSMVAAASSVAPSSITPPAGPEALRTSQAFRPELPVSLERLAARARDARAAFLDPVTVKRWLVGAWAMGVALLSIRLLGGWLLTRRLLVARVRPVPDALRAKCSELARRLRISRPVRLCESLLVEVPTVVGWLRPVILVPASTLTGLSPQQLEAVLAHELAHVRRHDYLVNLAQAVIETLLFYHPAVWWVSRRIRDEREHCCDDLAIQLCGDPVGYARALCELEEGRAGHPELALAATGGSLLTRVRRILGMPSGRGETPSRWLAGALAMAAVLTVVVAPSLGRKIRPADAAEPVSVTPAGAPEAAAEPDVPAPPETPCPNACPTPADCPQAPTEASCPDPKDKTAVLVIQPVDGPAPPLVQAPRTLPVLVANVIPAVRALMQQQQVLTLRQVQLARVSARIQAVQQTELAQVQVRELSDRERRRLERQGVDLDFTREVAEAGMSDATIDELVALRNSGIDADDIRRMTDMGLRLSVAEMIALAQHGVDAEWVAAMQWLGYEQLTVGDLVNLASHGVDADEVSQLRSLGYRNLSVNELLTLASHGITADKVAEYRAAGLRHLSVDELVKLASAGVDPDFVAVEHALDMNFGVDDLVQLAARGVDADYVMDLVSSGAKGLDAGALIQLHEAGVSGETVRVLRATRDDCKKNR
jgi:beta-lactamase regulating signal transducer with metallopeptidase domain